MSKCIIMKYGPYYNECTKSANPCCLHRTETVPSMHAPAALFLAIYDNFEMKLSKALVMKSYAFFVA